MQMAYAPTSSSRPIAMRAEQHRLASETERNRAESRKLRAEEAEIRRRLHRRWYQTPLFIQGFVAGVIGGGALAAWGIAVITPVISAENVRLAEEAKRDRAIAATKEAVNLKKERENREENERLSRKNDAITAERNALKEQNDGLKSQLESVEAQLRDAKEGRRVEVAELEKNIEDLEKLNKDASAASAALSDSLQALELLDTQLSEIAKQRLVSEERSILLSDKQKEEGFVGTTWLLRTAPPQVETELGAILRLDIGGRVSYRRLLDYTFDDATTARWSIQKGELIIALPNMVLLFPNADGKSKWLDGNVRVGKEDTYPLQYRQITEEAQRPAQN